MVAKKSIKATSVPIKRTNQSSDTEINIRSRVFLSTHAYPKIAQTPDDAIPLSGALSKARLGSAPRGRNFPDFAFNERSKTRPRVLISHAVSGEM